MHDDGDTARTQFLAELRAALEQHTLARLVLAGPLGPAPELLRLSARPVRLRDGERLSLVYRHPTRDVTRNIAPAELPALVEPLIGSAFGNAHLFDAAGGELQYALSRKGRASLRRSRAAGTAAAAPAPAAAHDRAKHRHVDIRAPFLAALGVTDAEHRLIPAMARKWKQINKFVELLGNAVQAARLDDGRALRVMDFGAGKGYLTFAVHDHLRRARGLAAEVRGVELREDLVALCNSAVERLGLAGLAFEQGDVRHYAPGTLDVMIALHACDTATDHAMHMGIRSGASVIMCSPCCHKQLRPQMTSPRLLLPLLQHGIHLGQQAEMLTDGLRALLLEAEGYDTQVFEFTALEHTSKNKMILAVKRAQPRPAAPIRAQIGELKQFYGVRDQCLESLLDADRPPAAAP